MSGKRVKLSKNYSIPFIACGYYWWDIVHEDDEGKRVCSYHFPDIHPKDPRYDELVAMAKNAAQCVVDMINRGLESEEADMAALRAARAS